MAGPSDADRADWWRWRRRGPSRIPVRSKVISKTNVPVRELVVAKPDLEGLAGLPFSRKNTVRMEQVGR